LKKGGPGGRRDVTQKGSAQPAAEHEDSGDNLLDALRAYGAVSTELTKRFAASLGLHSTDASALIEIFEAEERGTHLSPARLSERIGLTSGATSSLLNRLEDAGHLTRTREHPDRRIVTLHSSPAVRAIAKAYFDPLALRVNRLLTAYPPAVMEQLESFLHALCDTMEEYIHDIDAHDAGA
jgi:DNA-binding MarR family transcriptional regulator